ncbi:hypothetical protein CQ046_03565 [Chryseobacterium sp. MYb7]|jgi:hypothetical protein|uniref:hypothetical protein n=1 Tax=Chryseobacterium sp. MYb7 TaxID=1827290 RepID=UPI000D0077D6|nr:hypothetical protein [Chryseobacterium sp. MYb7]PRB05531.1 hypothetical protein CQ046_03565 [Chryseobacterium sp. MYb7]
MKYTFYALMMALSLISCENNDNPHDDPRPIDKEMYQFEFKSYTVNETILYRGAFGEKSNPQESILSNYWSLYKDPAWKKIILNLKDNSIQLIAGNSADATYSVKIINDSVLINDNNTNKPTYIGDFNKEKSTFTLKRTLQYMKRESRGNGNGLTVVQSVSFGTTQYSNMFGILFITPSDMTKSEDQVLWSNIEYYYKKL